MSPNEQGTAIIGNQYHGTIKLELDAIDLLTMRVAKTDLETAKRIAAHIYSLKLLLNVPM